MLNPKQGGSTSRAGQKRVSRSRFGAGAALVVTLAMVLASLFVGASSASATSRHTKTQHVAWILPLGGGPHHIIGNQKLGPNGGEVPACTPTGNQWVQADIYDVSTPAKQAIVNKLIAGGVLNIAPSQPNDEAVYLSNTWVKPPRCATEVTTAPVTFTEGTGTCVNSAPQYTKPFFVVPQSKVAAYYTHGAKLTPGKHEVEFGASVTVQAKPAKEGTKLTKPDSWSQTFGPKPELDCRVAVTPAAPALSQGTGACVNYQPVFDQPYYTTPVSDQVAYYQGTTKLAAGNHDADFGTTVAITTKPVGNVKLTGTTEFKLVFNAKPEVECSPPPQQVVHCKPGSHLSHGMCVVTPQPVVQCASGSHMSKGQCVVNQQPVTYPVAAPTDGASAGLGWMAPTGVCFLLVAGAGAYGLRRRISNRRR